MEALYRIGASTLRFEKASSCALCFQWFFLWFQDSFLSFEEAWYWSLISDHTYWPMVWSNGRLQAMDKFDCLIQISIEAHKKRWCP